MESHDGLLYSIRREYLTDFTKIIKREMERPINFSACSLPRRSIKIPAEIEIGENYMEFKKFKFPESDEPTEAIRPIVPFKELSGNARFQVN